MEYDVFISCKSEDYQLAEIVYQFLKNNGLNVFLSTKELRKLKDTEYLDAISEALDSAYHLIVLSSTSDNIKSKWVKFEWQTFLNELLSERKQGQIMTILKDLDISELPIALRKYESFTIQDFYDRLLPYVETPNYLKRKEEEKQIEEENRQKAIQKIKEQLQEDSGEYSTLTLRLEDTAKRISSNLKKISINKRVCPVCGTANQLLNKYCEKCGWSISPILGIPSMEYMFDQELQNCQKYKDNWIHLQKLITISQDLSKKNLEIQNKNSLLEKENQDLTDKIAKIDSEKNLISTLKIQIETLKGKLLTQKEDYDELNLSITKLNNQLKEKIDKISALEDEIKQNKKSINDLHNELSRQIEEKEKLRKELVSFESAKNNLQLKESVNNIRDKSISYNELSSSKKTFTSKEEVGKFVRKFCKNTPRNKDTIMSLKINTKACLSI